MAAVTGTVKGCMWLLPLHAIGEEEGDHSPGRWRGSTLQHIDTLLEQMRGCAFFSKINLALAYHQIRLLE